MANTRNYTDHALEQMLNDLDDSQRKLLELSGALPKDPLGDLHIPLRSKDVARLIELSEEQE